MSAFVSVAAPQIDEDTADDLLYSARFGDLIQLEADVSSLSASHNVPAVAIVNAAVDQHTGNTLAHFACANGHLDVLKYLIALGTPPSTAAAVTDSQSHAEPPIHLIRPNNSQSTPLHYAALNDQVPAIRLLLDAFPAGPDKSAFVSAKNAWGRDAALEAENAGKDDVVTYLLGVMDEAELQPTGEHTQNGQPSGSDGAVRLDDGEPGDEIANDVEDMDLNDRQSA